MPSTNLFFPPKKKPEQRRGGEKEKARAVGVDGGEGQERDLNQHLGMHPQSIHPTRHLKLHPSTVEPFESSSRERHRSATSE